MAQYNVGITFETGKGVPQDEVLAVEWFRKSAEGGYANGQYKLAFYYEKGRGGLTQSDAMAATWCRAAAETGAKDPQFTLGRMYAEGKGVSENVDLACMWWRKASEQEHAKAKFNLGMHLGYGMGVPVNFPEALRWLRKAEENGHQPATDEIEEVLRQKEMAKFWTKERTEWWDRIDKILFSIYITAFIVSLVLIAMIITRKSKSSSTGEVS